MQSEEKWYKIPGNLDNDFPPFCPIPKRNSYSIQRQKRLFCLYKQRFLNNDKLISFMTAMGIAFTAGLIEGFLLSKPKAMGRLRFIFKYSRSQLFPSTIWMTKPAGHIAHSMGLKSSSVLRKFNS